MLEHRVLYVANFAEAVYVLHAFEKRSAKTARADVDLADSDTEGWSVNDKKEG